MHARNITIDTLMVLFVLRAVGKLAENVEVQEACTMLDDFYCYINDNNKIYFNQVQGTMAVTDASFCDFIV